MNKAIKILDRIISTILIVLVAFLAVGVTVTIVLRYFFGISFAALEEFLTMSFIFITLFGSAIAVREKQHISIAFLADKIVGKSRTRKIRSSLVLPRLNLTNFKEQLKAPDLLLKVVEQGKESGVAERRSFPRSWCLFPSQVSTPKIS